MEEIKPVVTKKLEFENRHESIILAFFWKIRTIRILMQVSKQTVIQSYPPPSSTTKGLD